MPLQPREEDRDGPGVVSPAAIRALVQVLRQHEVERHGVWMIAEAEVSGNWRNSLGATSREDDGVVVGENVVVVIDEPAGVIHRSESAVPVEDVVVGQPAVHPTARTLAALGVAGTELGEE